eukprot:scaffold46524_cov44-Cyclotella_meneghiniana.AAC.1
MAAKLSTKEKTALKEVIKIEWNRGNDIETFFKDMEDAQWKAEKWGVDTSIQEMVNHAVAQMEDSGLFEDNFLMDWEEKEEYEQTWNAMKTYFTKEYRKMQRYSKTKQVFERCDRLVGDAEWWGGWSQRPLPYFQKALSPGRSNTGELDISSVPW